MLIDMTCADCVNGAEVARLRADNERLRKIALAAEGVWQEFKAGGAFACDSRKQRITMEAMDSIAAIGRLLEEGR